MSEPLTTEEEKDNFSSELTCISSWIHTLNIVNMKITLDLEMLAKNLPTLTTLNLTYGIKYSGMDYSRQSLGMKLSEAAILGEAMKYC